MIRILFVAIALLAGCALQLPWQGGKSDTSRAEGPEAHAHAHSGPMAKTPPRRTMPEGAGAPLFNDLGEHHYPVTTTSALAQRYFDQGLALTYAFNHAEAIRSYREAQRLDPGCAMCFWGEAYALGPNINKPMDDADVPAAFAAAQKALAASKEATPRERALIEAIAKRYPEAPVEDRSTFDRAYADAMREVAKAYPDDLDVQVFFSEAVMDTMPWDYYVDPETPKPEAREITKALESVLERNPDHFGAIHLYIHVVEASTTATRAEAPADRLRNLGLGAGHLVHMPSHIYLRVGRYADASLANEQAAAADESYITQCRVQGFYPAAYYPHNIHFLWAAASFEGRSQVALAAAKKVVQVIPEEMAAEVPLVEEFFPTYLVGLARFGKWDAILAQPKPTESLRYLTGMWHYARGVAQVGKGDLGAAATELASLRGARTEFAGKTDKFLSGSTPHQLLGIAENVLSGRIAGAKGDWTAAAKSFRKAVQGQDALPYTEPPPWYFPTREALGHALLQAGKPGDAETVYREQLGITPRNGWSLRGLALALRAQGKSDPAAAIERRFGEAWAAADVEIESSIF